MSVASGGMARHARNHAEGDWHHLFNRGARRWPIFHTDIDRGAFVALLGELTTNFAVEIHAFCLMGNHYHLVARFPERNVSAAMAHLGQMYTQQFNHHHQVDGPLFRGRFGSVPINDERQVLAAVRYVARNPLDLPGLSRLSDFRWSSHRSYLGMRRPPGWLKVDMVLGMLGGPSAYRSFVEDDLDEESPLGVLIEEVERLTGAGPDDLHQSRRGSTNIPRQLLAVAVAELAIAPLEELAASLGYSSGGSLRSAVRRARKLRMSDAEFRELCNSLLERVD